MMRSTFGSMRRQMLHKKPHSVRKPKFPGMASLSPFLSAIKATITFNFPTNVHLYYNTLYLLLTRSLFIMPPRASSRNQYVLSNGINNNNSDTRQRLLAAITYLPISRRAKTFISEQCDTENVMIYV